MAKARKVRSADGRLLPFRERHVAEQIFRALEATGDGDRDLAAELAAVVSLFLQKYHGEEVLEERDVDELACRVLRETGHGHAARSHAEMQRSRQKLEAELTVRDPTGSITEPGIGFGDDVQPWDRARFVLSLVKGEGIPESLAEEMAASVEALLIRTGLRSVTTVLLRELVDHEFLERGLEGGPGHARLPGPRTRDIEELVAGDEEGGAPALDRWLASPILEEFASRTLHGREVIRAHGEGRIHLHGLDDPFKVERAVLKADLLFDDTDLEGDPRLALVGLRRRLDAMRGHVRAAMVFPDLAGALARAVKRTEDALPTAEMLLEVLDWRDAYGEPTLPRPHLVVPLGTPASAASPAASPAASFLVALRDLVSASAEQGAWLSAALAVDPDWDLPEADELDRLLAMAADRPETVLTLVRAGDPPLMPQAGERPVPLVISLGRMGLNLPMTFFDAHGGAISDVLGELDGVARLLGQAYHDRYWHQRRGARQGLHGLVVALGGPGRVQVHAQGQEVDLEVWGLAHALELLVGRGVIHPGGRPGAAARILGYLDYVLGEEREGIRLRVRLGGARDREVRRRFLDALEGSAQRFGAADVEEVLRNPDRRDSPTLPVVVPLLSPRNQPLFGSAFAERLAPGLALSLSALGTRDLGGFLRKLAKDTRLGLLTLAPRREGEDLFEVQEELFS